ncbi:MAG: CPBP family glutamic-type intramembrane protease [Chitinophagaceae bacterium]
MEPQEIATQDIYVCTNCNQPIAADARFCNHCGAFQATPDMEDAEKKQHTLVSLTIFFGVQLAICLFSNFTQYTRGLVPLIIVDAILSAFTIVYVIIFWKDLKRLFAWKSFSIAKLASYASTAIIGAIVVNYAVKWLNKTIFNAESYYYSAFSHLKYARLATILMVALQPAIFEELAFRGVMQEGMNKITDTKQAIFISAFLFSLLHMSFISFFWLMPFALWLGYIRVKEETIWYGMIIHFCFNTTACFLEFFELNLF